MLAYSVTNTEPWTYLDDLRNPVRGFRVTFKFTSLNETHWVYVQSLDPAGVKAAIEKQAKDREALQALGK